MWLAAAALLLVCVSVSDYFTGLSLAWDFLYLAPVLIGTRKGGASAGLVFATAAALAWAIVQVLNGQEHEHPGIWIWNVSTRFAIFSAFGWALARRVDMIRQCAWCRRVHDGATWTKLEQHLVDRSHCTFTHGMCPDCFHAEVARARQ